MKHAPLKLFAAAFALFAMSSLAAADDLEDSYTKLKDAVAKRDAAAVKESAAETLKLAQAAQKEPQPSDASEVDHWKQTVAYSKDVESYTEYALATTAAQAGDPAKTVDLIDTLIAQNPKSKFLDDVAVNAYLVALGKSGGTAKQMAGMAKIVVGRPDNTIALQALVEGSGASPDRALGYANKLITAMKGKAKPEGIAEPDWEKQRNAALAIAYFTAGYVYFTKSIWVDCDKDMKAALPLLSDNERQGAAYLALGACNFNLGKQINDRTKMQAGEKYSEQSAAIKSKSQDQAFKNVQVMKQALAGR